MTGDSEPRCSTCGEVVHRDGYVWAHADPHHIYGHVARVALRTSSPAADAKPVTR